VAARKDGKGGNAGGENDEPVGVGGQPGSYARRREGRQGRRRGWFALRCVRVAGRRGGNCRQRERFALRRGDYGRTFGRVALRRVRVARRGGGN